MIFLLKLNTMKQSTSTSLLALLGIFALVPIIVLYSAWAYGFVLYKFYYWFLIPVFGGLPLITFVQAIGISCFVSLFKNNTSSGIKDEYKDDKYTRIIGVLLAPWLGLFGGWVIKVIVM